MTMTVLTVVQVLLAIAMIAIILVQRGPGASAGSGFGAGASATVFGARGSGSFLTRTTAILASVFFGLSLFMAVLVSRSIDPASEIDLGVMGDAAPAERAAPGGQEDVPQDPGVGVSAAGRDPRAGDVPTGGLDDVPTLPAVSADGGSGADSSEDPGGS